MVRISFQKLCHQCGDNTKNMLCWNEKCNDFGVIRIIVTIPMIISCDICQTPVNNITANCNNKMCYGYGEREDDYFDEDDMIMELILHLTKTDKNLKGTVIDERCRTFISENEYAGLYRCHSSMKEDYVKALKSKVEMVQMYLNQCKIENIIPNEWCASGVRNRRRNREVNIDDNEILREFYIEFGL